MKWIVALAVIWAAWTWLRRPKATATSVGARAPAHDAAAARDLLGVGEGADADTIRAAHRRLLATAHPDRGGSTELAGRANAARDLLLRLAN